MVSDHSKNHTNPGKNYANHLKYVIVVDVNMGTTTQKKILSNGKIMVVLGLIKSQSQATGR